MSSLSNIILPYLRIGQDFLKKNDLLNLIPLLLGSSAIVLVQFVTVPSIFSLQDGQKEYFETALYILSVCALLNFINFLPILSWHQEDLATPELTRRVKTTGVILPSIKATSSDYKYNLKKLLTAPSSLAIMRCAVSNPKLFTRDFLDCIKQLFQAVANPMLKKDDINNLMNQISKNNLVTLDNVVKNNDLNHFRTQMRQLKDVQCNYLAQENIEDYDQQQFKSQLEKFEKFYNNMKETQVKASINDQESSELKSIESFVSGSKVASKSKVVVLDGSNTNQFENTQYQKLASQIQVYQGYDLNIDHVLAEQQCTGLSGDHIPLKLEEEDVNIEISTEQILKILNEKLEVEKVDIMDSNGENVQSLSTATEENSTKEPIRFNISIEETDVATVIKRIEKFAHAKKPECYPYFSNLIKDFRKININFKDEFELMIQLTKVRNVFGKDFNKELTIGDDDIRIKVSEVKNGFLGSGKGSQETNFKQVIEIFYKSLDLSFPVEVTLSLESIICWKTSDEIISEFFEVEQDVQDLSVKKANFFYMEGDNRWQLRGFQQAIIGLCCLGMLSVQVYTGLDQWNNINVVQCRSGSFNCYNWCMDQPGQPDICMSFQNQFKPVLNMTQAQDFQFCGKFYGPNDELNQECKSVYSRNGNTAIANGLFDACQQTVPNQTKCLLNSIMDTKLSLLSNIQSISTNLDSQVMIDTESHLSSDLDAVRYQTDQGIMKNTTEYIIRDASLSHLRVCLFQDDPTVSPAVNNQLYCSKIERQFNYISNNTFHGCAITYYNQIYCYGENYFGQLEPPLSILMTATQVSAGAVHTCAISKLKRLQCWGDDEFKETRVPEDINVSVEMVKCSIKATCFMNTQGIIHCFGNNFLGQTTPAVLDDDDDRQVAFDLGLSQGCGVTNKEGRIVCWGDGGEGNFNYPDMRGVIQFSAGPTQEIFCILQRVEGVDNNQIQCFQELIVGFTNELIQMDNMPDRKQTYLDSSDTKLCALDVQKRVMCQDFRVLDLIPLPKQFIDNDVEMVQVVQDDKAQELHINIQALTSNGDFNTFLFDEDKSRYPFEENQILIPQLNLNDVIIQSMTDKWVCYQIDLILYCQDREPFEDEEDKTIEEIDILTDTKEMCIFQDFVCFLTFAAPDRVGCVLIGSGELLQEGMRTTQLMWQYQINQQNENTFVTDMTCGDTQVCVLQSDGSVQCRSMTKNQHQEQLRDVYKIKNGQGQTCVMKYDMKFECDGMYAEPYHYRQLEEYKIDI